MQNKAVNTGTKAAFLIDLLIFLGTGNTKIETLLLGNKGTQGNFVGNKGTQTTRDIVMVPLIFPC